MPDGIGQLFYNTYKKLSKNKEIIMIFDFMDLFDLRWLLVFSPITTAIAWGMIVYQEFDFWTLW